MCFVHDERLQAIVEGEYQNERGRIKGVFTTVDDAYALININLLERLLHDNPAVSSFTVEEAINKYAEDLYSQLGEAFYERYTQDLAIKHEQKIYETRCANAKKGGQARRDNAKNERYQIIKEVLSGKSLEELIEEFGFKKSKIYKVITDYRKKTYDLYADFKRNPKVFEGVSETQVLEFINCEGSFKALNKTRAEKAQAEEAERAEVSAKAEAFWKGVEEKYQAYQTENTQEPVKVKDTDSVTIDNLQAVLGVSTKAPAKKAEEPIEDKIPVEVSSKKQALASLEERMKASAMAKRKQKARVKSATPEKVKMSTEEPIKKVCVTEETETVTDKPTDEWGNYVD